MAHVFRDPTAIARYAGDATRKVPGFADLHRMAIHLLAEQAPDAAEISFLGPDLDQV